MDEERQSLLDTSYENTQNVVQSLLKCSSVEQFLNRDEYIRIRSSNVSPEEQDIFLNVKNDLDGVVLGLYSLKGIKFQVRYVNFLPHGIQSLKQVYPLLKKHLPLYDHKEHLSCLRAARGIQLFYEHGWDCSIALIPSRNAKIATAPNNICMLTYEYFKELVCLWRKSLSCLLLQGQCVSTLMKNTVSSLQRLHILPDDQEIIFQALNVCIDACDCPQGFEPFIFVYRFGERSSVPLNIDNEFNFQFIRDQSVHVAVSISGNSDIGFLWSRNGLERVIGDRGTLTSCLSFSEAANFQSNLDGRLLDVSKDILKIANFHGKIRFVQFYGDTPHVYPQGRQHPVSGSIVNCGLLHGNALTALERGAQRYINVCRDNTLSFINKPVCRLEFVIFPNCIIPKLKPNELINTEKLSQLLRMESIVVPFDNQFGLFTDFLKAVGSHLVNKLEYNFDKYQRLGKYVATWETFQYELAIEKFLWGRPLSFYHPILSVNLGPGLGHPTRSKTDWLGFLALDETGSSLNDSPPPLDIWFKNETIMSGIETLFTLNDYLNASNAVLGRKVIITILEDLYLSCNVLGNRFRFNYFLSSLKSGGLAEEFVCVGCITLTMLGNFLSEGKCVKGRLSTKRMREMLGEERPYVDLLIAGLRDLKVVFFPAVQKYDTSRNNFLHWNGMRLWSVSDAATDHDMSDSNCQSLTQSIIHVLSSKKLIYQSKLLKLQTTIGFQFPWINATVSKLADSKLTNEDKMKVLVFVSCVALMQQGWYVSFNDLKKLERDLPMSQFHLKGREILSTKLLGCVTCLKVFRLHPSIPVKIARSEPEVAQHVLRNQKEELKNAEAHLEYGQIDSLRDTEISIPATEVVVRQEHEARHVSVGCRRKWSGEELEIVYRVSEGNATNARDKYKNYLKLCLKEGVPDRPFESFKRKLYRV